MATIKQATGSMLDSVIVLTTATSLTAKEIAGTTVDVAKQTRKLVNVVGSTIDYSKMLMDQQLKELELSNSINMEIINEVYADEEFRKKAKEAKRRALLAKYDEPVESEITL